jgi:hypothetical protein
VTGIDQIATNLRLLLAQLTVTRVAWPAPHRNRDTLRYFMIFFNYKNGFNLKNYI